MRSVKQTIQRKVFLGVMAIVALGAIGVYAYEYQSGASTIVAPQATSSPGQSPHFSACQTNYANLSEASRANVDDRNRTDPAAQQFLVNCTDWLNYISNGITEGNLYSPSPYSPAPVTTNPVTYNATPSPTTHVSTSTGTIISPISNYAISNGVVDTPTPTPAAATSTDNGAPTTTVSGQGAASSSSAPSGSGASASSGSTSTNASLAPSSSGSGSSNPTSPTGSVGQSVASSNTDNGASSAGVSAPTGATTAAGSNQISPIINPTVGTSTSQTTTGGTVAGTAVAEALSNEPTDLDATLNTLNNEILNLSNGNNGPLATGDNTSEASLYRDAIASQVATYQSQVTATLNAGTTPVGSRYYLTSVSNQLKDMSNLLNAQASGSKATNPISKLVNGVQQQQAKADQWIDKHTGKAAPIVKGFVGSAAKPVQKAAQQIQNGIRAIGALFHR